MMDKQCPLCGIGVLEETVAIGCECSNCGEMFRRGKYMEWEVVPYEDWRAYVTEMDSRKSLAK